MNLIEVGEEDQGDFSIGSKRLNITVIFNLMILRSLMAGFVELTSSFRSQKNLVVHIQYLGEAFGHSFANWPFSILHFRDV